ncbi:MAG TPA: ATP-dependent protease ATPase subunit HslU [Candidatus Ligilactobacillus excrementigallinarum]|uniref:ATP-dependent protease ATPase subunit HslU n=1 Tax=Candidatus Ligilactobacillus excrementigallinarum TaxID=2838641 RepID=A0A9D2AAJ7_9LACO|nr:ATP-dependent protease ATPase subunit HslU [Candidatus Ligilactobacillus excrementigallinarum]
MKTTEKTPSQIVDELNKYIIGQNKAKKAVAVALRNRYRRMQLSAEMQDEIKPKNLLMIGPTGVGKTEIARRLAKIVNAPFVKVEATKFTEVGYVGRDVESMVRDLVEVAYKMEQDDMYARVRSQAVQRANQRLVKALVPAHKNDTKSNQADFMKMMQDLQKGKLPEMPNPNQEEEVDTETQNKRKSIKQKLEDGFLENEQVTIQMEDPKQKLSNESDMLGQMGVDLSDLNSMMPKRYVKRTLPVKEAREIFVREESEQLVDSADIAAAAIKRAENSGIIFIDEIDKIASNGKQNGNGQVSREGVQRDILPIVEGSQIKTKYGIINTDHILFIGSGAFAESKPSDLIAELQGRFPIRVELDELKKEDFVKILTEPKNALIKQYIAMIGTDNISVTFTIEAIEKIAEIAYKVNHENENIGARRLHTILEKLLEDLLYEGPDMQMGEITITEAYVEDKIGSIAADKDLSRYIL